MLARPFLVALTDAIAAPLLPQGLAADAQDRGRPGLAPAHLVEHVADVGLFHVLDRRPAVASRPQHGGLLEEVAGEGGGGHGLAGRVEGGALHHRAQLPHVARPVVALERLRGIGGEAGGGGGPASAAPRSAGGTGPRGTAPPGPLPPGPGWRRPRSARPRPGYGFPRAARSAAPRPPAAAWPAGPGSGPGT